jgi:two-component system sensor histidine kinase BaeS
MEKLAESNLIPSPRLLQMVARTLRHEVGDLLQTLYSAVAIFRSRLPETAAAERRLLSELHIQAEVCKSKLDAIQDLTCPLALNRAPTNLADVIGGLASRIGPRFPQIRLNLEGPRSLVISADGQRLSQVGYLLLVNACHAAQQEATVHFGPAGEGGAEWVIADDGLGVNEEQMTWLTAPFSTTHFAQFGLGLALARRVVELHGGQVSAGNRPEGGFRVVMTLPAGAPT